MSIKDLGNESGHQLNHASGRPGVARPSLPRSWRLGILFIVVVQFMVGHGFVWRHMFDWNGSIFYSYLTIPVLVFFGLAVRRQLHLAPWFLDTIQIAFVKFAITASALMVLLIVSPNPVKPVVSLGGTSGRQNATTRALPVLRAPPPAHGTAELGEVHGVVALPGGAPAAGTLVFIAGIDDYDYPPPAARLVLENDGVRIEPSLVVAEVGQTVEIRTTNAQLHTILVRSLQDATKVLFNLPVLSSGTPTTLPLDRGTLGLYSMACTIHHEREAQAYIAVLPHPFFQIVGPDGRFNLKHIPMATRALWLHAFMRGFRETVVAVEVKPGQSADVLVTLLPLESAH